MNLGFDNIPFLVSVILFALISAAHILSALLGEKHRDLVSIISVLLHLGLLPLLYLAGADLRVVLLFLLTSVLVYSSAAYIAFRLRGGEGE